ncbi:unnamed protein product, partial [Tilletia laevis]
SSRSHHTAPLPLLASKADKSSVTAAAAPITNVSTPTPSALADPTWADPSSAIASSSNPALASSVSFRRASTATLFASRATRYRPHHLLFLSWIDSIKDPSIGIGTRQCQFKQVRIHSYAKRRRLQLFNLNRDNCAESSAGGLDPSSPMEPCTVTNTAPLRDSRCRDLTCPLSFD